MTTVNMLESYSLYNNKPFSGSYEMRNLLESHLSGKIKKDLEQLQKEIDGGEDKDIVLDRMCSSDEFEKWFADIKAEGNRILSR
jgi:multiple sugar transport system substrate-binding protein